MRWLVVVCIALFMVSCGSSDPPAPIGSTEVQERIQQSTDCEDLQAIFDRADTHRKEALARNNPTLADVNLSYMNASYGRMVTLSCPGQ